MQMRGQQDLLRYVLRFSDDTTNDLRQVAMFEAAECSDPLELRHLVIALVRRYARLCPMAQ